MPDLRAVPSLKDKELEGKLTHALPELNLL